MRYATAIVFFCTLELLFCGVSNSVSIDRPLYGELQAMPQDIIRLAPPCRGFPQPTRLLEAAIRFKVEGLMSLGFPGLYRINAF